MAAPIALTATIASFITSPLHVPVRSLFAENKEVDGEQACKIAWKAVRDDDLGAVPGAKTGTGLVKLLHSFLTGFFRIERILLRAR